MFLSDAALLDNDSALVWLQILLCFGGGVKGFSQVLLELVKSANSCKHLFDFGEPSQPVFDQRLSHRVNCMLV